MKDELFDGAPVGTLPLISDSGFINSELFILWLKHFQQHVKSSEDDPVLLLLDNHVSHCSLEAVTYAEKHSITLISLPPHASHRLQPLDRVISGPMKTAYAKECDKWLVNHPGRAITLYNVARLFRAAYSAVASVEKAEQSFQATGICPFNPDVFGEVDFAPSTVTDRPDAEEPTASPAHGLLISAPGTQGSHSATADQGPSEGGATCAFSPPERTK